jgi:peptide-methionine (R)-S-oxide reductase
LKGIIAFIPDTMIYIIAGILFLSGCSNQSSEAMENTRQDQQKHKYYSQTDTAKLVLPDAEWKKILPADVYEIARHAATERAFTGKYWDHDGNGKYYCAACGNYLFLSDSKFASSCGWPSFYEAARPQSVIYKPDNSYGMNRVEVLCGRCDSHLGHIFDDGPPPTGKRFCMNSLVLDFEPLEK